MGEGRMHWFQVLALSVNTSYAYNICAYCVNFVYSCAGRYLFGEAIVECSCACMQLSYTCLALFPFNCWSCQAQAKCIVSYPNIQHGTICKHHPLHLSTLSLHAGCGAAGGLYNPFGVHNGVPNDETRYVSVHNKLCMLTSLCMFFTLRRFKACPFSTDSV